MTLVELMIAVVVLLLGLLGFSQAILHAVATNQSTRESDIAGEAARQMLETLQATEFDRVFKQYNSEPGDDFGGAGTGPGPNFAVPGLVALPNDPDGMVGEILFPTTDAIPGMLREDLVNSALGMPRDLDGNGVIDSFDHSTNYRILPVVVRMTWRGTNGVTRVEFRTLLGEYL